MIDIDISKMQEALEKMGLGKVNEDLSKAMQEMQEMEVTGSSGADMVVVTVVGGRRIKRIAISEDAFGDREILEDLITSATNSALEKAEEEAKRKMSSLPGALLSGFGAGPQR